MSRSNAAAINRRVNVPAAQSSNISKPSVTIPQTQTQPQTGLTLPQVISVFDNRLILLEKFMNETKTNLTNNIRTNVDIIQHLPLDNATPTNGSQEKANFNSIEHVSINDFNTIINEFNSRFELFAHEITDLKDIVLKLQSYTMDVNKTLLEEREKIYINSFTNTNLANTNDENLNTNNETNDKPSETDDKPSETNDNSVDLKNLIKQEFLQTN